MFNAIHLPGIQGINRFFFCGAILVAICACLSPASASGRSKEEVITGQILDASESLFKMMSSRQYSRLWPLLSRKSQAAIIENVLALYGKNNINYSPGEIESHFRTGDGMAGEYWEAYLEHFDPGTVLEESRWEMGEMKPDRAEIFITHRKSKRPARLQMFLEDGQWKVGLVETFRKGR